MIYYVKQQKITVYNEVLKCHILKWQIFKCGLFLLYFFFLNLSSTSYMSHPMTFQWENPLSRSIYSEPTALTLNSPQQFYGILAPTDNLNHHSSLEGTWFFGWERQFTAPVQARSCCPVLCVLSPLGFIILTHTKALNVYLPN